MRIKSIKRVEEPSEFIDITTEAHTFIVGDSGLVSHNSYQPSLDQFGKDSLTYIPSSPFCLQPGTPVLTEDLRWVPVETLKLGDKLIGFDEHAPEQAAVGRRWRQAEVTETSIIQAPRYKLTTEGGKEIVGTGEHLWLAKRVGGMGQSKNRDQAGRSQSYPQNWCWIKTSDLRPGDQIKSLGVDPWEDDDSRDAGYLAGFFDGGGYSQAGTLGAGQNRGPVLDKVLGLLRDTGLDIDSDEWAGEQCKFRARGGLGQIMKFMGTVRPERLLPKFINQLYGTRIYGRSSPTVDTVVSVEYLDEGPVVALGTSTHTLVADGLLSHNTKVGRFYSLYKEGSVMMSTYDDDTGRIGYKRMSTEDLGMADGDAEEAVSELTANPEMLIVQLPSWGLYKDWQRAPELVGHRIKQPIQSYDDRMKRLEKSNPEKFNVERRCLDPNTRVLGADLQWHRIADLKVGQELVGVDEEAPGRGAEQRRTVVEALAYNRQAAYRITFEDDSSVVCSGNHRWLSASASGGFRWRSLRAQEGNSGPRIGIKVGDRIRRISETWETDNSRGEGYLRGLPKPRLGQVAKRIAHIEELPEQDLVDIQTSTRTFIAEGLVSHNSQFASVMNAWLDPQRVEEMFEPWDGRVLKFRDRGILGHRYYMHCDPALNNDNFALAIGHSETAPEDEHGDIWPHVVIDFVKVWKPTDFDGGQIDYIQVLHEIETVIRNFPSLVTVSFDQWQNQAFIPVLKRDFPQVNVTVENFTASSNLDRMERFKTALNLGWIHSPRDNLFNEQGDSLMEMEMKFLQKEKNKVDHPDFGPVTTKDLFDCVNVVTDRLLKDALDVYNKRMLGMVPSIGSTNVNEIRSGRAQMGIDHLSAGRNSGLSAREIINQGRDAAINRKRGRGVTPSVTPRQRGRR